jgi:hypothetical protein
MFELRRTNVLPIASLNCFASILCPIKLAQRIRPDGESCERLLCALELRDKLMLKAEVQTGVP